MIHRSTTEALEDFEDMRLQLIDKKNENETIVDRSLRETSSLIFKRYFDRLEGEMVTDFYRIFLSEFEPALLESVMTYTRNNQTKASEILNISRGTLHSKLKRYGML